MAKRSKGKTSDAVEILRRRFVEGDAEMEALVRQERDNLNVAQQLYDRRTEAGLTQQQLAERVGTTASAICRLEDADYEAHSLNMLRRVAAALDCRVEVRLIPLKERVEQSVQEAAPTAKTGEASSQPETATQDPPAERTARRARGKTTGTAARLRLPASQEEIARARSFQLRTRTGSVPAAATAPVEHAATSDVADHAAGQ